MSEAKRFGALDLAASTNTVLMEAAAGFNTTVNVRFVNRNATDVIVRLALVDAPAASALAALSDEDYLEYDARVLPFEVLENTALIVPEGFSLVVRSDTIDVSVTAFGFEEPIV